ncbi:MAG: DNA polymerase III subunit gamma/tau [Gammaproteobacteria bacterium]|nr:DNA polymerase III subunit gamma/tau [Gammaproteobacteria bacterium]MCP4091163.1 DNA polymerase III subunit gamma/tau [Gammaproteobacteria bacterium]MCP4277311.1 DNA polymerase III subunit gamma/tau [Gammaproteobacteria bacterium]MCP4831628.1 DNA polymerase III subunit gamma/tau [Gammaproteobacteria bacterium]MCP4927851.1 DNA polymerase III subunit gamma/tau [Gammaproteobacteria bacterium]
MSYLALARKWRPKNFTDVVGQEHIVRALRNALESDRVHHAYLFSGTRGVGKTTVARILAKALNCEAGVSGEPCGECGVCTSIDEGRFVDLIEVDAASRTKVDDTRELLENVQYTPTSGRYKVYLIDEVHMLSNHSFNALLKTLEEPPPHVKFLLATTDPQKLPVTVLSRCLQFNLKRLSSAQIIDRMSDIGVAEGIKSEPAALARIARAANGSMRDALSLLDQARAFGDGELTDADVAEMLGSMDQRQINELLQCLIDADAIALMAQIRALQELVPDYESVLDDIATVLQQIAVVQLAGMDALDEDADLETLQRFAGVLSDDLVQLYYQIAITGRRDLGLAPDPRVGFEMTLLRMLAFQPADVLASSGGGGVLKAAPVQSKKPTVSTATPVAAPTATTGIPADADWPQIIQALNLTGAARHLAESCSLASSDGQFFNLHVPRTSEYLLTEQQKKTLLDSLQAVSGASARLEFKVVDDAVETIATRTVDESEKKMQAAHDSIEQDPNVQKLVDMFGAKVEKESIKPVNGKTDPD